MKANVIGIGVTGFATVEVLRRLGHQVRVRDTNTKRQADLEEQGYLPTLEGIGDITFFCVPEWNLEEALESTTDKGLWVIRSTTRPGDVKGFQDSYARHIVHLPEFLREATALSDALNPDRIVIGECCAEHGALVADLFAPLLCPTVHVDTSTSEMIKLVSNAHLSTLLSFWNEIHQICETAQINSTIVGKAVSMDNRISSYGALMHGKPFGGFCLPKDLNSLIDSAHLALYQPLLLEAVQVVNAQMADSVAGPNTVYNDVRA